MSKMAKKGATRIRAHFGRRDDSGQVMVEFALIIPIFLLLSLILLDVGRAYFTNQIVLNAAREGARVGTLPQSSPADVDAVVAAVMAQAGYRLSGYSTNYANIGSSAEAGTTTTVTVTSSFGTLTGTFIPGWTGNLPLGQTIRMRHE